MKSKRLYGASFEESQNLVDKKFVMKSCNEILEGIEQQTR